ncbi:hypothetical protein FKM82_012679 [Ascaphus truei]
MLVANWLAGLLCHLCFLHTRSWESRLHPKQASFVKNLQSYEIITPSRINDFGEVFPHPHHFRRRKRSLESQLSASHAHRTHYRFTAYGQLFQFNLSVDASFITDSYHVVHIGNQSHSQHDSSDLRHCFYRGYVNALETNTAMFSLCGGMIGTFKAHDGEYFLEPLMKADGGDHEDEHNKPHLIYKNEIKNVDPSGAVRPNCDISESGMKEKLLPFPVSKSLGQDIASFQNSVFSQYSLPNWTQEVEASKSHIRKKRFLSYPRYVELMVAADAKMVRHHGRNLQHYILTLMSIEGPAISFNAATTLHNFCVWQKTQNIPDDSHPSHHDTAVLLTREDICRASDKCDTLGLAELGTMCDPYRSCSISEENGLGAAFTIAHEVGHVFNMPHDDSFKCKEAGIKNQFHVMAPTLNYNTSPWTWSKCSQKYITEFLDTGYGECLLDKPSGRMYELSHQLPGVIYDVNKQCELMFGPGSQVCPYLKQCKRLWCTSAEGVHKGCRTQHMPLADGSDCGPGMHCHHGLCVNKEMDARTVDGEWGQWGPYSSCSRTCGGGIKTTTRDCNEPEPRNEGKYCVGRRMKFRSCNTESCPKEMRDFRDKQCSNFDGKHFNINGLTPNVRWIPKYSGILMKDRCKLFCRASGTSSYYQLKDRTADGTPCGPETDDICVQGLCRQAGCDHVLNSKARRDKCGVCGGDNSSCKTLAGTFNSAQYGYNTIVKIPIGATNIDIHQHSYSGRPDDDNYLECLVTCGKGNKHRQVSCQLNDEPLKESYCDPSHKPEAVVPCERQACASWQVGSWGPCTVTCGYGYQMRTVKCITGIYGTSLDERECNAASRPTDSQDCEMPSCPGSSIVLTTSFPVDQRQKNTQWRYGSWTPCSTSCGRGNRARYVSCRDVYGGVAEESFCDHLPRPAEVSNCFTSCGEWQSGDWSPCPVTCGNGKVMRQVVCISYHQRIEDINCDPENRPIEEQECNIAPCTPYSHYPHNHDYPMRVPQPENPHIHRGHDVPDNVDQRNMPSARGNQWRTGPWGACSSTCAGGFERRVVVCQDEEGRSSHFCDQTAKPPESRHCDSGPCPQWNHGTWGECTQTCGGGMRTRSVICQLRHGQHLDDQSCEILDKPPNEAQCNTHACPADASWHPGPWKSCSVTCGKGVKHRDVRCVSKGHTKMDEENCKHLQTPRVQKICRAPRCPSWKAGKWKECSVTCGVGIHHREVYCRMKGQGRVHEAFCNHSTRPDSQKYCWLSECVQYYWIADEWPSCSTECKQGESRRKIKCVDISRRPVNETYCDPTTKPPSARKCKNVLCKYTVVTEDMSQCTGICWPGYKQRITYCKKVHPTHNQYTFGFRTISYKSCPVRPYSFDHKCNGKSCVQAISWKVGKWSKCSVTCGLGIMERRVGCMTENAFPSDLCPSHVKPPARKTCLSKDCDFKSCKEISLLKNIQTDGEYTLKISNRRVKIYCSGMQSDSPKEYITLVKGETDNFSEVFGYRLKNPYECPFNGSRRQDCACKNDYLAAGYTAFSKIRLDIISMQIKTTDLLFAQTVLGRAVPFATAGDCYSAAKCPQGQFSISLSGTDFRISNAARWIAQGNYATVNVHRSQDGTKIYGRCGGYCGKCVPHSSAGLQVQVQEK